MMEYKATVDGTINTHGIKVDGSLNTSKTITGNADIGSRSGVIKNYNKLENKPQINSVELVGDKSSSDLKLQDKMEVLSAQEIEKILYLD